MGKGRGNAHLGVVAWLGERCLVVQGGREEKRREEERRGEESESGGARDIAIFWHVCLDKGGSGFGQ